MKPQLRVEGVIHAEGLPTRMASGQQFILQFSGPSGVDRVENTLTAGEYIGLGLVPGNLGGGYIEYLKQRSQSLTSAIDAGGRFLSDEIAGEGLYLGIMTYFWEVEQQARAIAAIGGVVHTKHLSEGLFTMGLAVTRSFGVPLATGIAGVVVDVDRLVYVPEARDGNSEIVRNFMTIAGLSSSGFEHGIVEQLYNVDAISAVEALSIANGAGLRTYNVTASNAAAVVPGLSVPSAIKTDIKNAVVAGKYVTIPEQEITIGGWVGIGYIITDPATGSGAYMISGGFSGGTNTTCEGGPVPTAVVEGSDPDIVGACALKIVDGWKKAELNLGKIAIIAAFITTISLLFLYAVPGVVATFTTLASIVPVLFVLVTLAIVIVLLMYGLYLAILNLMVSKRRLLDDTVWPEVHSARLSIGLIPQRGNPLDMRYV